VLPRASATIACSGVTVTTRIPVSEWTRARDVIGSLTHVVLGHLHTCYWITYTRTCYWITYTRVIGSLTHVHLQTCYWITYTRALTYVLLDHLHTCYWITYTRTCYWITYIRVPGFKPVAGVGSHSIRMNSNTSVARGGWLLEREEHEQQHLCWLSWEAG
jgi:hypothetical protein